VATTILNPAISASSINSNIVKSGTTRIVYNSSGLKNEISNSIEYYSIIGGKVPNPASIGSGLFIVKSR